MRRTLSTPGSRAVDAAVGAPDVGGALRDEAFDGDEPDVVVNNYYEE
ncbi:hypothetical protein [Streptomyces colonosanans]|nr:hypothetical protein [Streptomyces colonosanans]